MSSPRVVDDQLLCRGRRVALYRRIVEWDGRLFEKDLVSFGRSVVIVPELARGRLIFVRQWRAPIAKWIIELPAGRVEPGEDPREAAARELEEETGYRAGELESLGRAYVSPGYSDELIEVFTARKLAKAAARPDEGEFLEVVELNPLEYIRLCGSGEGDLKSLAAILLYAERSGWLRGA
ncbi:MAG: NUDIX hydrolase [Thermofilum sp.]